MTAKHRAIDLGIDVKGEVPSMPSPLVVQSLNHLGIDVKGEVPSMPSPSVVQSLNHLGIDGMYCVTLMLSPIVEHSKVVAIDAEGLKSEFSEYLENIPGVDLRSIKAYVIILFKQVA